MKIISFIISLLFYLIGVGGLFLMIFWMGNFLPFRVMDSEPSMSTASALLKNAGLLMIFGVQHSVMARQGFKQWWTKIIPKHLERSIYVMVSGVLCALIVYQWEPISGSIWNFTSGTFGYYIGYGIFIFGILFLLASTFLVNHFELFGLQQSYQNIKGSTPSPAIFKDHWFYKIIRHPIYLGFFMILFGTPKMTMTHLCLALGFTVYIYIGIYFEEKDLINYFGDTYRSYKKRVPKLIPFLND